MEDGPQFIVAIALVFLLAWGTIWAVSGGAAFVLNAAANQINDKASEIPFLQTASDKAEEAITWPWRAGSNYIHYGTFGEGTVKAEEAAKASAAADRSGYGKISVGTITLSRRPASSTKTSDEATIDIINDSTMAHAVVVRVRFEVDATKDHTGRSNLRTRIVDKHIEVVPPKQITKTWILLYTGSGEQIWNVRASILSIDGSPVWDPWGQ